MKHLILGAGNLGRDLLIEIAATGIGNPELASSSRGTELGRFEEVEALVKRIAPDVVWLTAGYGSVEEASNNPATAAYFHVQLPVKLRETLPETSKLVVFSSDYAASEEYPRDPKQKTVTPRSLYAKLKRRMEEDLEFHSFGPTAIVRVCSLYGTHKPEKCFPGKVIRKEAVTPEGERLTFPQNVVTPTPTRWLARMLALHFEKLFDGDGVKISHCAPAGNVSVHDWAKFSLEGIAGQERFTYFPKGFDEQRPKVSSLCCSFAEVPHWYDLWKQYYNSEWFRR